MEGLSIFPTDQANESYLQVRAWTGYSIRLILLQADGTDREMLMGRLERAVVTGALISLEVPARFMQTGDLVRLEVFARSGLVQCHTRVQEVDSPVRTWLDLPERIDVIQRRQHPRVSVRVNAAMRIEGQTDLQQITVINLSAGGLAFAAPEQLAPGTRVWLHLETLGLAPAEIPARVVRNRALTPSEWEMGAAFEAMNPAQVTKVAQYVAALLADEA